MNNLKLGEIVLLKFPFSDGITLKRRPALIINDFNDGDILVCRITSQIYQSKYDVYVEDWEESGLKLPSVIRVHKLATLEKEMVGMVIGSISDELRTEIKRIFMSLAQK